MKDDNAGLIIGLAVVLLGLVLIGGPMLLGHQPLQTSQPGIDQNVHGAAGGVGFGGVGASDAKNNANKIAASSFGINGNLGNTTANLASAGQTSANLVAANNNCVTLIKQGKNEEAIELLEPLLKTNPDYGLARDNLAIAYNNQALKQADNPRIALDSLWRSSCLTAKESKTAENIDAMLTMLHKDPKKFADRVALADAQMAEGCLYGSYSEYSAALAIHYDAKIKQKLDEIEKQAAKCGNDDINGAFFVKMAARGPANDSMRETRSINGQDIDFGPYMSRLQRSIKGKWFPPDKRSSEKTQVMFNVARNGTISNLRVSKSSGDIDEDQAGLAAVKALGKAEALPAGAPPSVDIQFTLDYSVMNSAKKDE